MKHLLTRNLRSVNINILICQSIEHRYLELISVLAKKIVSVSAFLWKIVVFTKPFSIKIKIVLWHLTLYVRFWRFYVLCPWAAGNYSFLVRQKSEYFGTPWHSTVWHNLFCFLYERVTWECVGCLVLLVM